MAKQRLLLPNGDIDFVGENTGKVVIANDEQMFGEFDQIGLEPAEWDFWSRVDIAAAATTRASFFTVAFNPNDPAAGNMEAAGMFPTPQLFFCKGFSIRVLENEAQADADLVLNAGVLKLSIADKTRFFKEATSCPASGGSYSSLTTRPYNGIPDVRNMDLQRHWLRFQTLQQFFVTLEFGSPGITPSAITSVVVTMHGMWGRQSQ